jgi:hypothetical protein
MTWFSRVQIKKYDWQHNRKVKHAIRVTQDLLNQLQLDIPTSLKS